MSVLNQAGLALQYISKQSTASFCAQMQATPQSTNGGATSGRARSNDGLKPCLALRTALLW